MSNDYLDFRGIIAELKRRRDVISQAIAALEAIHTPHISGAHVPSTAVVNAPAISRTDLADMNLGDASVAVLRQFARPMTNHEIASVLEKAGHGSKSKNMPNNVGTALWRELKGEKTHGLRREGKMWVIERDLLGG